MSTDDINPFMDEKDAEKFYDENKYSTLLVNTEEFSKKNKNRVKELVDLFVLGDRESKDEALKLIKEFEGKEILLEAVAQPEFLKHRAVLVAACWECGLDFSRFFDFFMYLTLSADYLVTLEAITVIESMEEKIPEEILKIAKEKLEEAIAKNDDKKILLEDLKAILEVKG
ncbi:MAG: hypothetical protein IAF38_06300 [Bacteroidia bacterium]|nr:hypothetical protein [Bacteroidia bacterium]